jgi:hypothetical protein
MYVLVAEPEEYRDNWIEHYHEPVPLCSRCIGYEYNGTKEQSKERMQCHDRIIYDVCLDKT